MHRNTYLLVLALGIFAALVAGVNIGRSLTGTPVVPPQVKPKTTPATAPVTDAHIYTNYPCGFSVTYPPVYSPFEDATGSAMLLDEASKKSIVMTCQKNIPRPALPKQFIETMELHNSSGSTTVSATLYHDRSAKDGTPQDSLFYRNPAIGKDIYIAGFGDEFTAMLKTLTLIP
jgi:hypothetical protein